MFRDEPDIPRHVVELAKHAEIGFEEALPAVLSLVSRDLLEIEKRDHVAGDHLVRLTRAGRALLGV